MEDLERKATLFSLKTTFRTITPSKPAEVLLEEDPQSPYDASRRARSPESRQSASLRDDGGYYSQNQYLRPPSPGLPPASSYSSSASPVQSNSYTYLPNSQPPVRYSTSSSEYPSSFQIQQGQPPVGHYYSSDPSWSSVQRSSEGSPVKHEDYEEELDSFQPNYAQWSGIGAPQYQQHQGQHQQQYRQLPQIPQQQQHHYQQSWQGHNAHVMPPISRPSW